MAALSAISAATLTATLILSPLAPPPQDDDTHADRSATCTQTTSDSAATHTDRFTADQFQIITTALELLAQTDPDARELLDHLDNLTHSSDDDSPREKDEPRGSNITRPADNTTRNNTRNNTENSTTNSNQNAERNLIDKLDAAHDDPDARDLATELLDTDTTTDTTTDGDIRKHGNQNHDHDHEHDQDRHNDQERDPDTRTKPGNTQNTPVTCESQNDDSTSSDQADTSRTDKTR